MLESVLSLKPLAPHRRSCFNSSFDSGGTSCRGASHQQPSSLIPAAKTNPSRSSPPIFGNHRAPALGTFFLPLAFVLSSREKSDQLNGHLVRPEGQYFVHIPVGQALALMQPDTPAAKSFVWLKCSWGLGPIRGCSEQGTPTWAKEARLCQRVI